MRRLPLRFAKQPQRSTGPNPWVVLFGLAVALCCAACRMPEAATSQAPHEVQPSLAGEWRLAFEAQLDLSANSADVANLGESTPPWSRIEFDDTAWRPVQLPATWSELDLEDVAQPFILRHRLRLPESDRDAANEGNFAVVVDAARFGAYQLFVNGRQIGQVEAGEAVPTPQIGIFQLPPDLVPESGFVVLAQRFERSAWAVGGAGSFQGPIGRLAALGPSSKIEWQAEWLRLRQQRRSHWPLILAGLAAIIGLYHLARALRLRLVDSNLFIGTMTWAGFILVLVNEREEVLFATHDAMRRSLAFGSHLLLVLVIEMVWRITQDPVTKPLRWYQASHLLLAASSFILPVAWVSKSVPWRLGWTLPVAVWMALRLAKWAHQRAKSDRLRAWFIFLLPIALGVDLLLQLRGFNGRYYFSACALIIAGAIKAFEASDAFHRVHWDLEELRQRLELEVDDQTEELASTNRQLKSQINERGLVEDAMRMLERAVEQSADGIAVTDLSGSTEFLNQAWAELHGHDVYDVLGYEIGLFHTTEQMHDEVFPLMTQVRQHGSFQGEVGHRRQDGSTFPAWMSVTRLQGEDGDPVGMVSIARDITEKRHAAEEQLRLEAEARQAEKLESLAILAAGIAHDFNNLLTSILGNASMLARELPAASTDHSRARQVERAADRAARLSDQLLSYAGEDQMAPQPQALNGVIESLTPAIQELVPATVTLQFQLKGALPLVKVDREQVHQVLVQLVRNGVEALDGAPGVITLRTSRVEANQSYFDNAIFDTGRPAGTYVFFEVSDSGTGIEPEILAHIFDPFFSTRKEGRGLGLASSLGIVRAHGGAIKVYSQRGRGTTFEVLFPASQEEAVVVEELQEVSTWRGGGTILVADDEELVREVAKDILEAQGFEVITAEDGRQAVRLFRQRRFDIRAVLLDLTMPNMDGEQAFRAMRLAQSNARVVLMSGYSKQQILQRLEGEGIAGFLHKPFRPEDLIRMLKDVLDAPR